MKKKIEDVGLLPCEEFNSCVEMLSDHFVDIHPFENGFMTLRRVNNEMKLKSLELKVTPSENAEGEIDFLEEEILVPYPETGIQAFFSRNNNLCFVQVDHKILCRGRFFFENQSQEFQDFNMILDGTQFGFKSIEELKFNERRFCVRGRMESGIALVCFEKETPSTIAVDSKSFHIHEEVLCYESDQIRCLDGNNSRTN